MRNSPNEIGAFWIPKSAILYVGLAETSVRKRVDQYYRTHIGHARRMRVDGG